MLALQFVNLPYLDRQLTQFPILKDMITVLKNGTEFTPEAVPFDLDTICRDIIAFDRNFDLNAYQDVAGIEFDKYVPIYVYIIVLSAFVERGFLPRGTRTIPLTGIIRDVIREYQERQPTARAPVIIQSAYTPRQPPRATPPPQAAAPPPRATPSPQAAAPPPRAAAPQATPHEFVRPIMSEEEIRRRADAGFMPIHIFKGLMNLPLNCLTRRQRMIFGYPLD